MFVKLLLKKAMELIDLKLRRIVAACFGYAQEFFRVEVVDSFWSDPLKLWTCTAPTI